MKSAVLPYTRTDVEPGLKKIILFEIAFPMILLVIGITMGLLQVLFRAGIIRSQAFLGINYYQGLTLHGAINAIVFTTFFAVAFGHAIIRFYTCKPLFLGAA
ncbi:MAG TPA: hypothetical protein VF713_02255, partial [Thermoanaerobaculia bacterium]